MTAYASVSESGMIGSISPTQGEPCWLGWCSAFGARRLGGYGFRKTRVVLIVAEYACGRTTRAEPRFTPAGGAALTT